jgi:rubredoxin
MNERRPVDVQLFVDFEMDCPECDSSFDGSDSDLYGQIQDEIFPPPGKVAKWEGLGIDVACPTCGALLRIENVRY